ncbi:DUF7577 domain-containing protein [Halovenus marina]|uniref:DUF7577 domain-containing protein n=1 Tax=Halovenus marina TaxID=3396621 RepID=UPI003F55E4F6
MDRPLRNTLLWQVVGTLCYLAGMLLFLFVATSVFLAAPENSIENLTGGDVTLMLVGLFLVVLGSVINRRYGDETGLGTWATGTVRDQRSDQSTLEELGYTIPAEPSNAETARSAELDENTVRCPECGATNEQEFSYCKNCTARLPA